MSNNRFRFVGLADLRSDLRKLPKELRGEGGDIVVNAANFGATMARTGYAAHHHSGDLESHVVIQVLDSSDRIAAAIVKNTAKHAFIFENGTQVRYTKFGSFRGRMPPGNVFVPAMARARFEMFEELRNLVRRKGLRVTG